MASSLAAATTRKQSSIALSLSRRTVSIIGAAAPPRDSPAQCGMRLAVLNATTISPLPLPMYPPQRAMPTVTRFAMRRSCRESAGRSVAITATMLPLSGSSSTLSSASASSRPTGRPAMRRQDRDPKFVSTSTPIV